MAPNGWPQALFTVNLWAIGDAEDTPENLVNLVFRVFLPEIEGRDALLVTTP